MKDEKEVMQEFINKKIYDEQTGKIKNKDKEITLRTRKTLGIIATVIYIIVVVAAAIVITPYLLQWLAPFFPK